MLALDGETLWRESTRSGEVEARLQCRHVEDLAAGLQGGGLDQAAIEVEHVKGCGCSPPHYAEV